MVFWRDVEGGNVWNQNCVLCEDDSDSDSEDAEDAEDLLLCCFCSHAVHPGCLRLTALQGEHPGVPGEWLCGCCWREKAASASHLHVLA